MRHSHISVSIFLRKHNVLQVFRLLPSGQRLLKTGPELYPSIVAPAWCRRKFPQRYVRKNNGKLSTSCLFKKGNGPCFKFFVFMSAPNRCVNIKLHAAKLENCLGGDGRFCLPPTVRGFQQYRDLECRCLTHWLKQNSNSITEYMFFCLYCWKPVLAAVLYLNVVRKGAT